MKPQNRSNGEGVLAERLKRGEKLEVHELLELMDVLIERRNAEKSAPMPQD